MAISRVRRRYPRFGVPKTQYRFTVREILPGLTEKNYKSFLEAWGRSVWKEWSAEHCEVEGMVGRY